MMRMIIDITQLASWSGKLTGIPRVMYELSSRYDHVSNKTIFVIWNSQFNGFQEVNFNEIKEKRQNETALGTPDLTPRQTYLTPKSAIRRLYGVSPLIVKKTARSAKRFIKQTVSTPLELIEVFEFIPKDKLLVVWGEWGDQEYRQALTAVVGEKKVRLYQVVYDMLPLVTPQYSAHSTEGLRKYINEIYPISSALISISEHTKEDVQEWLKDSNLVVPPIHVIRLGEDFEKTALVQPKHAFFLTKTPYILCVGTIESRKNHTLLYYTYKLAKTRGIELPRLVTIGRRGWLSENIYDLMTNDPQTKDSFIFLHDAGDEELAWAYTHSLFSIYPSHYEGWGLPIAESISYGIPVIASNTSSMAEIAGDLINYFSPVSTDECLAAISWLLDETNRKVATEKLGKYKQTSWDETFRQTQAIIGDDDE